MLPQVRVGAAISGNTPTLRRTVHYLCAPIPHLPRSRQSPHKDEAKLAFIHLTAEILDICSAPESDQHNLIRFLEENPHLVSTERNI